MPRATLNDVYSFAIVMVGLLLAWVILNKENNK